DGLLATPGNSATLRGRNGVFVYFSGFGDFPGRADHWKGISTGVPGQSEKSPDAAFDLCSLEPDATGGGYHAGISDPDVARETGLPRRGRIHALTCRSHHGAG